MPRRGLEFQTRRQSKRLASVLLAIDSVVAGCWAQPVQADSSSFSPVYWQQSSAEIRPFTLDGKELAVALPREARGLNIVWFSPDGKVLYGQAFHRSTGITKIELKPARQSIVSGSEGLEALHLTVSPSSDKIFVAGASVSQATRKCGYFAIDPSAGTVQTLRIAPYLDCRLAGPISPDGKHAVEASGKQLGLLDLETGAFQIIHGLVAFESCNWSPGGKMLACVRDGRIAVVDVSTSRVRNVGGSGNLVAEWSPDGRSLLVLRNQLSCLPTLYGQSLAVVDLQTGRRVWLKSAHCEVAGGLYGWVDRRIVQ